jgi:hypothetical protein
MLILTDEILSAVARRSDILSKFPFMRMKTPPTKGCSKCNRTATDKHMINSELNRIKAVLVGLSDNQKTEFKTLLGVAQITLFMKGIKGVSNHVI